MAPKKSLQPQGPCPLKGEAVTVPGNIFRTPKKSCECHHDCALAQVSLSVLPAENSHCACGHRPTRTHTCNQRTACADQGQILGWNDTAPDSVIVRFDDKSHYWWAAPHPFPQSKSTALACLRAGAEARAMRGAWRRPLQRDCAHGSVAASNAGSPPPRCANG